LTSKHPDLEIDHGINVVPLLVQKSRNSEMARGQNSTRSPTRSIGAAQGPWAAVSSRSTEIALILTAVYADRGRPPRRLNLRRCDTCRPAARSVSSNGTIRRVRSALGLDPRDFRHGNQALRATSQSACLAPGSDLLSQVSHRLHFKGRLSAQWVHGLQRLTR
jgi:hypothetical protein